MAAAPPLPCDGGLLLQTSRSRPRPESIHTNAESSRHSAHHSTYTRMCGCDGRSGLFWGPRGGETTFCRIALAGGRGAERCSGLWYNILQLLLPDPLIPPVSSSCPSFTTTPVDGAGMSRAGPGPQRRGVIRDHALGGGPCEGGHPRGRSGLSHTLAPTPLVSKEPLRGAGGWGNRLLAVIDDAEGTAVKGQSHAPSKREESDQDLSNREWSARVWVTRREPRSHVAGCYRVLATAPLAPAITGPLYASYVSHPSAPMIAARAMVCNRPRNTQPNPTHTHLRGWQIHRSTDSLTPGEAVDQWDRNIRDKTKQGDRRLDNSDQIGSYRG